MRKSTRALRPIGLAALASCSIAVAIGCSATPDSRGSETSSDMPEALLGQVTFDNSGGTDCGPEQAFVRDSIAWGRTIAASPVFESCLSAAMNGPITLSGDIHLSRTSDG